MDSIDYTKQFYRLIDEKMILQKLMDDANSKKVNKKEKDKLYIKIQNIQKEINKYDFLRKIERKIKND